MSLSRNPDKKPYKSIYTPKNPLKYITEHPCICRSSWERQFAKWCDTNPNVKYWGSEMTVIPYISKVDGRWHRYFTDFTVTFMNGQTVLFEIKPEKQTKPPKKQPRKTKRFLYEVYTYGVNTSKWEAARKFAASHNMSFQILTEKDLRKMGLKLI